MNIILSKFKTYISLFLSATLIFSFVGCGENNAAYTKTGFYFDTVVNFCFYGKNAESAIDECINLAQKYDDLWNRNKEASDIYKINNSAGIGVEVSEETIELLNIALSFARVTNGAVTPSIGALSSLWDFKAEKPSLPDENDIADSLNHLDYQNIIIDENIVTIIDPETKLDPGFIAKGLAADKMKKAALNHGVTSGWINLGGNVLVIGSKPNSSPFNIGIQDPTNTSSSITTLSVTDCSVVTSGVYERFFELDGNKYFHILDTKTGYPVRNNLLSVSVIGPSSALCDGLSTSLFVLGIEEGNKLLEQYVGYQAIYITDNLELIYSTDTAL